MRVPTTGEPAEDAPDCGRFNCSNTNIRTPSWHYRGYWHQTCPRVAPRTTVCVAPIPTCKALRYVPSLPPLTAIGQFPRLLPSLEVETSLRFLLRNRTPIPRPRCSHGRPRSCRQGDGPETISSQCPRVLPGRLGVPCRSPPSISDRVTVGILSMRMNMS
jgi:hypothetical protein